VNRVFAVIAIAAIVIYPNVPLALLTAATPVAGPPDGWLQALDWMRMQRRSRLVHRLLTSPATGQSATRPRRSTA
jgi:hypothetical protein